MKIAITGHKKGIGQAFAKQLEQRNHTIIGISRSDGENIRRVKHTASLIESCDLFINNAISQYAQTELFFEVWQRWKGQRKWIWNIGSIVSILPKVPEEQAEYRIQKVALDESSKQLQNLSSWPKITVIRPGHINTQGRGGADVDVWVKSVLNAFDTDKEIHITELSIGPIDQRIPL